LATDLDSYRFDDRPIVYGAFDGVFAAGNAIKDSITIGHSPGGCELQLIEVWYFHDLFGTMKRLVMTNLNEDELVHQTESKLAVEIVHAQKSRSIDPGVCLVCSTSPAGIVGADLGQAIRVAAPHVTAPIVPIEAPAYTGDLFDGYERTLAALARHLVVPVDEKVRAMNVLGYFFHRYERDCFADVAELRRLLGLLDIPVPAVFLEAGTAADLAGAGRAAVNLTLPYGREAARVLEERCGQKTLEVPLPIGIEASKDFLLSVGEITGQADRARAVVDAEMHRVMPYLAVALEDTLGKKVAIVADAVHLVAWTRFAAELELEPVLCACVQDRPEVEDEIADLLSREGRHVPFAPRFLVDPTRREIQEALRDHPVDLVLGSAVEGWDAALLGIPHLQCFLPMFDEHCLFDRPTLGFSGALAQADRIKRILGWGRNRRGPQDHMVERVRRGTYGIRRAE
jgi:nitrogenase molybdenum-iron protein alpha/beta subunit